MMMGKETLANSNVNPVNAVLLSGIQLAAPEKECVLWGFVRNRNSEPGQMSFVPLYQVIPTPISNVSSHSLHAPKHPEEETSSILTLEAQGSSALTMSNFKSRSELDHAQPQKLFRPPYSPEVTRCLKKAFIDTVGQNRKLTKEHRRRLMEETGLNSRSLTYWFSNHKRRAPFLKKLYQEAVAQSRGQVKTYEDFELWWALSKK